MCINESRGWTIYCNTIKMIGDEKTKIKACIYFYLLLVYLRISVTGIV
jgi:hypothetical protein